MITVVGKGGITARVIADSVNETGVHLTTFEVEVHRLIWSEFMTHRVFSRNAASSRAIPVDRVIDMVRKNPAIPIAFGKNRPGMQAIEDLEGADLEEAQEYWRLASVSACNRANQMMLKGIHKQVINRLLEPFVMMKGVVTSTEWENFFTLRLHKDADPHIQELARCMFEAKAKSTPKRLRAGEWHIPYAEDNLSVQDALMVSASCCAQVSYRRLDTSLDKARNIYDKLIQSDPPHLSPVEHQAMVPLTNHGLGEKGLTHLDRQGQRWSGNFREWIQYRQTL